MCRTYWVKRHREHLRLRQQLTNPNFPACQTNLGSKPTSTLPAQALHCWWLRSACWFRPSLRRSVCWPRELVGIHRCLQRESGIARAANWQTLLTSLCLQIVLGTIALLRRLIVTCDTHWSWCSLRTKLIKTTLIRYSKIWSETKTSRLFWRSEDSFCFFVLLVFICPKF